MILCVCRDDLKNTYDVGRASLAEHPDVFHSSHLVFDSFVPVLGVNEDLYVIAHGASDIGGQPMIGDHGDSLSLDAFTFWVNVHQIFPVGYQANVYISACESADPGPGEDFSFAETFAVYVKAERSINCRVFGHKGSIGGRIPLPDDDAWIEADIA